MLLLYLSTPYISIPVCCSDCVTLGVMDPDTYLQRHHLLTYVEDAVLLLLTCKDQDSKTRPFELLANYFENVRNGSHVVLREYTFVSATPLNRRSFIAIVWQTYSHVPECQQPMQLVELLSLLRLLCSDFPLAEMEKVSRILCGHGSTTTGVVSFTDFLYIFQITFYFDCFLGLLEGMLPSLLSGSIIYPQLSSSNTVVVPLPTVASPTITSRQDTHCSSRSLESSVQTDEAAMFGRAVSRATLLEAALGLCGRMEEREPGQSHPSQEALREVLSGAEELSLRDFVFRLSESDRVNCKIGALPTKA